MTRRKYPTDLTEAQWQILRSFFRKRSRRGRPTTYDRMWEIDALLYVVRTGCPWRGLPHDYPPWKTASPIFYRGRLP